MKGRSCFLSGLLLLAILFLSFSHVLGRVLIEKSSNKTLFAIVATATFEVAEMGEGKSSLGTGANSREMMMVMDYDTGANVNTKGGPLPPPSQPAPAPHY